MKISILKLKSEIKNLTEPRRTAYGNVRHKLEDIIIIGLLAIICGGEDFSDMETFGREREDRSVIAVDGKTIRGSGSRERKAYHVVSAFVAENQITLGEITRAEKSNEITAVPELLDLIDVKGAIVTADAMSCQSAIVKKNILEPDHYLVLLLWSFILTIVEKLQK